MTHLHGKIQRTHVDNLDFSHLNKRERYRILGKKKRKKSLFYTLIFYQ